MTRRQDLRASVVATAVSMRIHHEFVFMPMPSMVQWSATAIRQTPYLYEISTW